MLARVMAIRAVAGRAEAVPGVLLLRNNLAYVNVYE